MDRDTLKKRCTGWMVFAVIAMMAAGGFMMARSSYVRISQKDPVLFDTLAMALDRTAVPAHALVKVSGKIDRETWSKVYGAYNASDYDYLFTLEGEKNLLLYCPHIAPCATLVALPFSSEPNLIGKTPTAEFIGRVYNYNDYAGPYNSSISGLAVKQLAEDQLHDDPANIRVIDLGSTPEEAATLATMMTVLAIFFAADALVLWILALKTWLRYRTLKM